MSKTVNSSKAKWSCTNDDIRSLASIETVPVVGWSLPSKTFKNVDFPAPLAPITPYVLPGVNFKLTSSYSFLPVNDTDTFETVSIFVYVSFSRF